MKLKQKARLSKIKLRPGAIDLFEKLAVHLASLRTPKASHYFSLPRDFCVNPTNVTIWQKDLSIDVSLDYMLSGGQAVQASFMIEKDGGGWCFMVHDPTIGVVKREWHDASNVAARSRMSILKNIQWFIAHLQSNHP
jgi:hypothetical protein